MLFTRRETHVRLLLTAAVLLFLAGSAATEGVAASEDVVDGSSSRTDYEIRVFTVASEATDGFLRYNRSARINGIKVQTLGFGVEWQGGDMQSTGGGYKLNLLKKALKGLEEDDDTLILFTDGYDVIFTQTLDEIVRKYRASGAGVLFGAEHYLWPDKSVQHLYPKVAAGSAYLNSGMFIGQAAKVCALLKRSIKNTEDDQLFFTRAFLDEKVRSKLSLKLDHLSAVFQNLNGAIADVTLKFDEKGAATLLNTAHGTQPGVIHGNGPSKLLLNGYGNYIAGAFVDGLCIVCNEQRIKLDAEQLPTVMLALFVERPTPFFHLFLELVAALDYPKQQLHLFVHNAVADYEAQIGEFLERHSKEYAEVKRIQASDDIDEEAARQLAVTQSQKAETAFLFVWDADARLDNAQTLRELLQLDRGFVAPLLTRPNEVWSNFWGALSESGFYARANDYMSIVEGDIRGVWNVPYVASCYLVKAAVLPKLRFDDATFEPDMALCQALRKEDIFMYVSNELRFGHLVNTDHYNPLLTRPDFYTMTSNPLDWEATYLHPEYAAQLKPGAVPKQPCPDVYWFPIVTDRFCADLIAIMEGYGRWSDGSATDQRLLGGYEAVPTRDIHMNQVGLEQMWLKFLQVYVRPMQESVYTGYYHDPPKSLMNFVVRYKPTEQPFLKPHHDSSTYTINIALNRAGVDYVGGGCRFLRYNCSVTDTKVGHMLMHPGRLTHFHEGLYVTEGTRYIMISFIDP